MKNTVLPLLLVGFAFLPAAGTLHAQQVTMKDGQVYDSSTLRRSGQSIFVKVTSAGGLSAVEMGLPVSRIAKISFPEPPELTQAMEAATKGKIQEVLSLTGPYVAAQGDYKDLPGSWWPRMASLRIQALAGTGKYAEAAALAREIGAANTTGADSICKGGTLFGSLPSGESEAIILGAKGLPRIGGDNGSALAQLALGQALLLKMDYLGALRSFLTVIVFYPSSSLLLPAALQGAADSYMGLKDQQRALQAFDEISSDWPDSPQAAEAKKKAASLKGH